MMHLLWDRQEPCNWSHMEVVEASQVMMMPCLVHAMLIIPARDPKQCSGGAKGYGTIIVMVVVVMMMMMMMMMRRR